MSFSQSEPSSTEFSQSGDPTQLEERRPPQWTLAVPPPSLGCGGLFVTERFKERHHPLPHSAAAALRHPLRHHGAAAAMVTGCEGWEGGTVHGVGPLDLRWVCTP